MILLYKFYVNLVFYKLSSSVIYLALLYIFNEILIPTSHKIRATQLALVFDKEEILIYWGVTTRSRLRRLERNGRLCRSHCMELKFFSDGPNAFCLDKCGDFLIWLI